MTTQEEREARQKARQAEREEQEARQKELQAQREEQQRREQHESACERVINELGRALGEPIKALESLDRMFKDNRTRLTVDETRLFDSIEGLIRKSIDEYRQELLDMAYEGCRCPVCNSISRVRQRLAARPH
jgi:hypothetical protein